MGVKIYLSVLFFATICLLVLTLSIFRIKIKKQITLMFYILVFSMLTCNFGYIIAIICENYLKINNIYLSYIPFAGEILLPVAFLFVGLIFAKNEIRINYKYAAFLIIPLVTFILLLTNNYHGLFFKDYRMFSDITYGWFLIYVHLPWTYGCVVMGLFYFIRFSIKNAGFFSRQALLIVLGSLIPFSLNIIWVLGNTTNNEILKLYSEYDLLPISFTFTIICYALAIFKFDFLNIVPIALQRIVDLISDSYIVINEDYNIIDYNRTFIETFGEIYSFKRKDNLINILESNKKSNINSGLFLNYLNKAAEERESVLFESQIICDGFDKFFTIEITPIYVDSKDKIAAKAASTERQNENYNEILRRNKVSGLKDKARLIGIIILLKDITEHKKNLQELKEKQEILLEQERLASLGQLIGGIAHNLKTPIMSLSGGIEALKDLAVEYRDSVDDRSVTEQDHKDIAREMLSWLEKMKPYCSYMSDVISAVKGQAVQMNSASTVKFTVDEVVKRVNLLLKHELKKYHCVLNVEYNIDMTTEIKGEVNNLVQVFDNIIINAIQSYEGQVGSIDMKIVRSGDNIEFTFKDYGKGISKQVAEKLFKEMVTTKGKNGTGLGLYMSYSTIKGRFGGNMSFVSTEGCGTTFLITIPCITYSNQQEAG